MVIMAYMADFFILLKTAYVWRMYPFSQILVYCFCVFFFFFFLKSFFSVLFFFRASSHQIVHKMNTLNNFLFQPSYLNSNFALSLGYLNPALKNQARLFLRYGSVNYTAKGRLPGDHLAVMMMMTMTVTVMMMMSIPCRLIRDVRPGL